MGNLRYILSIGLAVATLAVVLTYVLGAPALLQTAQAEEGHKTVYVIVHASDPSNNRRSFVDGTDAWWRCPHIRVNNGKNARVAGARNRQGTMGLIGNNILGSPATPPAGGLAVNVAGRFHYICHSGICYIMEAEILCRSRIAGGKWRHSHDTPSSEHEFCDSRSHNWIHTRARDSGAWCGKGCQNCKGCNCSPPVIIFSTS